MEHNVNIDISGGFVGLLTLLFVILKFCGIITWSWWWVLAPLWISLGIAAILTIIVLLIAVIIRKLK